MCSTASSATGAGSSISRARRLTRRALLGGTSLALGTVVASCMAPLDTAGGGTPALRGEPFADGSWFDDGFGWAE